MGQIKQLAPLTRGLAHGISMAYDPRQGTSARRGDKGDQFSLTLLLCSNECLFSVFFLGLSEMVRSWMPSWPIIDFSN